LAGLFMEAAATERKLPRGIGLDVQCAWPEMLPEPELAYGYNEEEEHIGSANKVEVRNYDWAIRITSAMEADDAKLVWACAHSAARRNRGPAWARIGRIKGLHAQTVKRRFERAILALWFSLSFFAEGVDDAREIA
jgi:hypothetical protein